MSKTKSASSGMPYLKPNDMTAMRTLGPASEKTGATFLASWWTLSPEVSITTSASARRSWSMSRSRTMPSRSRPSPCSG